MTREQRKEAIIKIKSNPEVWEKYKKEDTKGKMFYLLVALMNQDQVRQMFYMIDKEFEAYQKRGF